MASYSADQIYELLSSHRLTAEQQAVVEGAPLDSPALVIAGAGSGKTELMTVRVLYLIANSFATPDQVLGLTFTRKAASELSNRVNGALYKLRESEMWPKDLDYDFNPPNITTYNSFANDIFRKLSLAVGYESDAALLSEASAVALADELVRNLGVELNQSLEQWEKSKSYLIELVLSLAAELTDNQASADAMKAELSRFADHVAALPRSPKGEMTRFQYTTELLDAVGQNSLLADLAQRYQELKEKRNLVDFSDQVALAVRALEQRFDHGYRFVLLDEYQDTSTIQTKLLSKLFRSQAVLAVGDPNQAIYGWRGASSNNLTGFHDDFGSVKRVNFQLSKSWRSGPNVVAAANLLTLELNQANPELTPIELVAGVQSQHDQVSAVVLQEEVLEAKAVADWFESNLDETLSASLLLRTKVSMQLFADEISSRGIAVEVSGLSGLLQLAEVKDLISCLYVLNRPDSGAHLMRLLAGPKWRIGAKDLAELGHLAKKLSRIRSEVTASSPISIIEALDELPKPATAALAEFSELGLPRLVSAAKLLKKMRAATNLPLTQLAWVLVRELELDIELFAHSAHPNPLANLEAFISKIADYEQSAIRPTLSNLISWLEFASEKESFELPKSGAKKGVVQIMTVHAAKGLEWDLVAVSQLNKGAFPIDGRGAKGWLASGKLPFSLRGDSDVLPKFDYQSAQDQKELKDLFEKFQADNRARQLLEERRLAYVAITRARKKLLLSASHYKYGNKNPRSISTFLTELLEAELAELSDAIPQVLAENPLDGEAKTTIWPFDPLGDKRANVAIAATTVATVQPADLNSLTELTLLLEERERTSWQLSPKLPLRLSASRLMQLLTDPAAFSKSISRPMPQLFDQNAERGTNFHTAIEEYFQIESSDSDSLWESADSKLVGNFQDSRFANLEPKYIEKSIEFEIGGLVVVCKIDAVFEQNGGYEVVDWKSGSSPKSQEVLEKRGLQLSLYRIALAKLLGIGVERVRATFFFAADAVEVAPQRLWSESEIIAAISEIRKVRQD